MVELGAACLIAAPFVCAYAAIAAIVGARRPDRRLVDSSRRAIYAPLRAADDLGGRARGRLRALGLLASRWSPTTPRRRPRSVYKLTAMWSSQGGSLLLWAWVLSIASSGVLFLTRRRHREVVP